MLFNCTYLIHNKETQAQAYPIFANLSPEEIKKEVPEGCKLVARWHDLTKGFGVMIAEAPPQEDLMTWFMK